jgi:hypothetical protein
MKGERVIIGLETQRKYQRNLYRGSIPKEISFRGSIPKERYHFPLMSKGERQKY